LSALRIEHSHKILLKQLACAALCLSEGHFCLLARNGDERRQLFAHVMRLKELNSFPVDIAAPDFIINHADLSAYSRELSLLVSPTFLLALILLPDDTRYAVHSLFIAIHSTNVSAVCDLDTAIDHSILSIESCTCVLDAYTRYQESYATTVTNGQ
jgi:hypothetical protein